MTDTTGNQNDPTRPHPPYTPPVVPQPGSGVPQYPTAPPLPHGYAQPAYQAAGYPQTDSFGNPVHTAPAPHAQPAFANQPTTPLPPSVTEQFAPQAASEAAPAKSSGAGKVVGLILAAALVGGAAGLGGSYAGAQLWGQNSAVVATGPTTVTVNDTDSVNTTTAIAAKVVPSVVTISASSSSSGGTGSGVVLSSDGYVLTNTHVVTLDGATGAPSLSVTTSDGAVYRAELVGTDPVYDLAVIKLVDAEGLTPIEFADSSKLNVGDQSIAIGAPLGLSNTVTTGIISALNRSIEIASSAAPDAGDDTEGEGGQGGQQGEGDGQNPWFYFDNGQGQSQSAPSETIKIAVLQTDASINPGNSGGALVDSQGKLIGINVAIATAGGSSSAAGSIGVGFSIPSNVAERVANEIIDNGEASHGLLGASVSNAAAAEGATAQGALIENVTSGGAAAGAGLKAGDVVTGFNGIPITSSIDLTAQVRAVAAGSDATVSYVRNGKTFTADVTLGSLQ